MTKRNNRKFISLILVLATILTVLAISGCTDSGNGEVTTTVGGEIETQDTTEVTTADPNSNKGLTVNGVPLSEYKIVYYDTVYAKTSAQKIQQTIMNLTGDVLSIRRHTAKETEYEILVGKTGREESNAVREKYDRPNVYYDIVTSGNKIVIMGEGYTVLNKVTDMFVEYISDENNKNADLEKYTVSGNIKAEIDTLEKSMLERADGTDLRVFHWNMAAPYHDPNVTKPPVVYDSAITRGEVMADIILQLLPDIITTNEFYESHNGNTDFFDAVMGELGEYYTCLKSPYDKGKPIAGADAIPGKTINSNIIYRNDAELSVVGSSWRYSTEKTTTSGTNPNGFVYYHGSHTAVFSTKDGTKFIVSTSHYADSRSSNKWAKEHLSAISDTQAKYGEGKLLPVILTGDLYTGYTSSSANSGYKYLVSQGLKDAQRTALVNANNNISHGTFHNIGERQTTRISEDFVWYTDEMQALAFKVLTSKDIDDTSDHYPVIADIKFK